MVQGRGKAPIRQEIETILLHSGKVVTSTVRNDELWRQTYCDTFGNEEQFQAILKLPCVVSIKNQHRAFSYNGVSVYMNRRPDEIMIPGRTGIKKRFIPQQRRAFLALKKIKNRFATGDYARFEKDLDYVREAENANLML
jgi:hypothetical protein